MKYLYAIYKSLKRSDYYLYVRADEKLTRVPELLLAQLGQLSLVMTIPLSPERLLANASTETVINAISQSGYYLQMPPHKEAYTKTIRTCNKRL
jgi:uncharacterized protein